MSPGPSECPRCRSDAIVVHGTSPVADVWTVFGCATCFYTWRSDKYPSVFHPDPNTLADLPVIPRIVPLDAKG
jgi:hypothetical protein